MTVQEFLGDVFVALGIGLIAVAAVGLLRLPDVYNRANAVAKAAGLGLVSVLLGVVILAPGVTAVDRCRRRTCRAGRRRAGMADGRLPGPAPAHPRRGRGQG